MYVLDDGKRSESLSDWVSEWYHMQELVRGWGEVLRTVDLSFFTTFTCKVKLKLEGKKLNVSHVSQ